MHLQNSDASSAGADKASRYERLLSRSVDVLSAISIGLLVALGLWLWQFNGESVALAAIINGIANCF